MNGKPTADLALRGEILHCLDDPSVDANALVHIPDGVILIRAGRIAAVAPAADLLPGLADSVVVADHRGQLLIPGLVDCHVHGVQTDIIASYGEQLLAWLERYAFPAEMRFSDPDHAASVAAFFLDELLGNGTTTALVLGSVHPVSAEALFAAAEQRNMRLIAGKVMMDRHCPEALRDTPEQGYAESRGLIEDWHGRGRLRYAVTPRFAPTSSPAQLQQAARLLAEFPDLYLHTHLAENRAEVAWVAELFPEARSYLDVYHRFGLVRERSLFAHGIYLDDQDRRLLAEAGASIGFCPTCNLFIGSGLFDYAASRDAGVRIGLGTDVGGGTSFSLLRTVHEAYKVAQLQGYSLSPAEALYRLTLGSARALYLDDVIGNFALAKEADVVVLDPACTPLLARRCGPGTTVMERLFALLILGDDRAVATTYVLGERVAPSQP